MLTVERTLPATWDEVSLIPISDVHPGDQAFDEKAFDRLLQYIEAHENVLVLLNGDLINAATRTSKSDVYSSRMSPGEEVRYIVRKLEPVKDKILCVNTGNHEERISRQDGFDPAEEIADRLGVPYSREGALVFIRVGKHRYTETRHSQDPVPYTLYATHGWAGGRRPGSKFNALQELALSVEGADVYIVGHTHMIGGFKTDVYSADSRFNRAVKRTRTFVNAGSFLAWAGYAERYGYVPGTVEMPVVRLSGREKRVTLEI